MGFIGSLLVVRMGFHGAFMALYCDLIGLLVI